MDGYCMTHTVIGGGLAGLTAAVELARLGAKVRLIEQHHELGGRAATTEKDGFSLNLGPHAVYLQGSTFRTLTSWGILPSGSRPVLSDGAAMVMDGRAHGFVRSLPSLATCGFLSLRERVEAGLVWGKLAGPAEDARGLTMAQWLDREVESPAVRQFFQGLMRLSTYCGQPELQSAEAVLRQVAIGNAGVTYVDGGWRSMVRKLADYAVSLGVRIETGTPATEVGPGTILAVSPEEAARLTGRTLAPLTPIRMASLDLALTKLPEGASVFGLGLDQPLYLSAHSQWVQVAPPGGALVHVAKYLGASESDAVHDRAQLERFADLLMPGWREQVHYARFLPEMVVTHAVTGLVPRPDVDALEGVRIAGDWVGPDGMLADTAVASGLRAARASV
jgi:hypothetical protein